jgi:hypothetical protein
MTWKTLIEASATLEDARAKLQVEIAYGALALTVEPKQLRFMSSANGVRSNF